MHINRHRRAALAHYTAKASVGLLRQIEAHAGHVMEGSETIASVAVWFELRQNVVRWRRTPASSVVNGVDRKGKDVRKTNRPTFSIRDGK